MPSVVQFSDSHLFASNAGLHCGVNVFNNLLGVLEAIMQQAPDVAVFTGDLTQDHTPESYQLFNQLLHHVGFNIPLLIVAGNHDDHSLLKQWLTHPHVKFQSVFDVNNWQLVCVNTKSQTPAGIVCTDALAALSARVDVQSSQLVFMHHHPEPVGYFIDRHGLENPAAFWQWINTNPSISGVACGHVHRGMTWQAKQSNRTIEVFACPATSIQFDPSAETVKALAIGPGYRRFNLLSDGSIESDLIYLDI